MKYLIWTTNYRHDAGGLKVLHHFCHQLNEAGQEAYVSCPVTNPAWNESHHAPPLEGDWTAIYPETICGNPWNAPRVVRWVLNVPGHLGGDKVYDPAELVFVWHPMFMEAPPDRMLMLPTYDLRTYVDRHQRRRGAVFYVGKDQQRRKMPRATEITRRVKRNARLLSNILNRAGVLYTFDNVTGMADLSRLCGCRVIVIPDGQHTREQIVDDGVGWDEMPPPFDSAAFRARIVGQMETFRGQLANFIRITQA